MSDQNQNPKLLESILYLEKDKDSESLTITTEDIQVAMSERKELLDWLKDA